MDSLVDYTEAAVFRKRNRLGTFARIIE